MNDREELVEIPAEIANTLSSNQKNYLNQCSVAVRQNLIKIQEVLSLLQHEKKLGDFYIAFGYLEQALLLEMSPYVSVKSIMNSIALYSVGKDNHLFVRKGEINEANTQTGSSDQGGGLTGRRQGEEGSTINS